MGRDTKKADQTEVVIGDRHGLVTAPQASGVRRLLPTKKPVRTALLTVVVIVCAVGLGLLAQQILGNLRDDSKAVSGLPKQLDDIQNLRLDGKDKEADKKIDEALKDPGTSSEVKKGLYMQKAYSASSAGNLQAAADAYTEAVTINPDPQVYQLLGETYFQMGDKAKARAAYVKGIALLDANSYAGGLKDNLQQRIDIIDGKIDPTKE